MNRVTRRVLALLALAAGALAAVARSPRPPLADDELPATQLADALRARRGDLVLLDLRTDAAAASDRLPGAQAADDAALAALKPTDTLVVYEQNGTDPALAQAWRERVRVQRVLRLHGGISAWNAQVLYPKVRSDAPARRQREFEHDAERSRYFGGTPRRIAPGELAAAPRSRRGC